MKFTSSILALAGIGLLAVIPTARAHESCSGMSSGACNDGFFLNRDGKTCRDVDECSGEFSKDGELTQAFEHGCEVCNNFCGGFSCSCEGDRILDDDEKTCYDTSCPVGTEYEVTVAGETGKVSLAEALPNGETASFQCITINPNSTGEFTVSCEKAQPGAIDISNCEASCQVADEWEQVGPCSATCGQGQMQFTRQIIKGEPDCAETVKHEACQVVECPIDCELAEWSEWSECDRTCGCGTHIRTRDILTKPMFGGNACEDLEEWKACDKMEPCPVHCVVGEWSAVGKCTTNCGEGLQLFTRNIVQPQEGDGDECPALEKYEPCPAPRPVCPAGTQAFKKQKCSGSSVSTSLLAEFFSATDDSQCRDQADEDTTNAIVHCMKKVDEMSLAGPTNYGFNFQPKVGDQDLNRCCFFVDDNTKPELDETTTCFRHLPQPNQTAFAEPAKTGILGLFGW